MKIQREDCLALVIDIQEKLFPYISGCEEMLQNQLKFIKGMQVLGIPVIITEQYRKGIGPTVSPIIELFGGNFGYLEKLEFSCLENAIIKEALIKTGKKHILIIGIEAHVCVMQTVIDAVDCGLMPVVPADCIGSREQYNKEIAIGRMHSAGAVISTSESILFELLVKSGTQEFKDISKIVK